MIGIYVDNLQIVHSAQLDSNGDALDSSSFYASFLRKLKSDWEVVDEGVMSDLLGIEARLYGYHHRLALLGEFGAVPLGLLLVLRGLVECVLLVRDSLPVLLRGVVGLGRFGFESVCFSLGSVLPPLCLVVLHLVSGHLLGGGGEVAPGPLECLTHVRLALVGRVRA